ncbi:hypothetical protein niasHS_012153 [Heterodera schachtii]|uniref:Uncharacterized protein n=2 Tax=Heterodera TaxID=34509 RepID=A0ABD2ILB1_HETSC
MGKVSKTKSAKKSAGGSGNKTVIWAVEDIVDGPKYETIGTKRQKLYKVRWGETYELASNIPPGLIDLYEKREKKQIKILGPLVTSESSTSEGSLSPKERIPLHQTKFAIEIGDKVKCLSYSEVRNTYKEELLQYFEERAKIDEE